jgi:hypothetical protein
MDQSITVMPTVEVLIRLMRFEILHNPVKQHTCSFHSSWSDLKLGDVCQESF